MKIGIGITVHNRNQMAYDTIARWQEMLPDDSKLIVVDDGSKDPIIGADYRFNHNVGIASAKNKCLELLQDCEHIFLSDDDCYPKVKDWFVPYIESGVKHLSFTFDKVKSGRANGNFVSGNCEGLIEYVNPCGCMLYIHRLCLDVVGGFDDGYIKWGYEHVDFSRRVYNAGLTPRPFLDVPNSLDYFVSLDYEQSVGSSVPQRNSYFEINKRRYTSRLKSTEFAPFIQEAVTHGGNVVLTSYFNYSADTQRKHTWSSDIEKLRPLLDSLKGIKVKVFHNCFEEPDTDDVEFIKIDPSVSHSPNVYRWIVYYDYLRKNRFEKIWMVDSTDVECLRDPFEMDEGLVYCGNEHSMMVDNQWMRNTQERFVKGISDYRRIISINARKTLINCGLVGGCFPVVMDLLSIWSDLHSRYTAGLLHSTDMAVFNYVIWKHFYNRMVTGEKINTRFKRFEKNEISWWRHK
jgi:glycosyltransferase involved in cell wall biosynthesis